MSRKHAASIGLCAILLIVAWAPAPCRAADALDVSYVPGDAVAAVVLHPRRVLTSPDFEMLPIEVIVAASVEYVGIDPTKVEQAIGVLSVAGLLEGQPAIGAILRFSEPYDSRAVLERIGRNTEEATYADKRYHKSTQEGGFSVCMPDERTLLIGTEPSMRGMLKPPKEESPLVKLLKEVDTSQTAVALLDFETIHPLLVFALDSLPPVPQQLNELILAHEHINWIRLSLNFQGDISINLTLGAHNADSAQTLKELGEKAKALGKQFIQAQIAEMPVQEGGNATDLAMAKYLHRISTKLIDGIEITVEDDEVNVALLKDSPQIATTGVLVALLLPAVQSAREAARRTAATNELKQIGIAFHNYHDTHGTFPPPAITDANGKPLLSWRVAILPYLEEQTLYNQFHLDEPWDSEHNRKLIAQMPAVYKNPNFEDPEKTVMLGLAGDGMLFGGSAGVKIRQIVDGTSNTIVAVEANPDQAVIWTKPQDLKVDPDRPLAGLGNLRPGGFNALFGDASVRFISRDIDPTVLRSLFTYGGREPVNLPQ